MNPYPEQGISQACEEEVITMESTRVVLDNHDELSPSLEPDVAFNDFYDISDIKFKEMMDVCEKSLKISEFEISEIERSTRGQHVSSEWFKHRMYRLTASNFYSACVNKVEPSNKLKNMFYNHFENASTQHGMLYEKHAVKKYEQYLKNCNISAIISDTELIVSESLPFLGASLDDLVTEENTGNQWLVEIKCPFSMHSRTLAEALESKTFFFCHSGG